MKKIEKDKEMGQRKKDEINATDRERKKWKVNKNTMKEEKRAHNEREAKRKRLSRMSMSSGDCVSNLERRRNAYNSMPRQQKDEYRMKEETIAIRKCRENQADD